MRFEGQLTLGSFEKACKLLVVFAVLTGCPVVGQDTVDVEFGFQENAWSDPTSLEFTTTRVNTPGSSWGNEDMTDFYVETGAAGDQIDAVIPGSQGVVDSGIVVASFETRYLTDTDRHSYLVFGSDFEFENAVFFGHGGGGLFHTGTGTEFNLSEATPSGVDVERSFALADAVSGTADIGNDSRIGVRIGFEVDTNSLRNFQVDSDNDGEFELEFIEPGNAISMPNLTPQDWFLITYAGRGRTRADNVSVKQQSLVGDYNQDLDFDHLDANIICRNGIVEGDPAFDYNGDGQLEIEDINDFAFDHESLPADMDFNGSVEFADFLVLSGNFGKPGDYSDGDITCNGKVDFPDFLILSTFFGSSASQAQTGNFAASQAVPEPNSSTMVWMIVIGVLTLRKRD